MKYVHICNDKLYGLLKRRKIIFCLAKRLAEDNVLPYNYSDLDLKFRTATRGPFY